MSDRTDVSLGYLSQIELGKNSASIETLYRICLALGHEDERTVPGRAAELRVRSPRLATATRANAWVAAVIA